MDLPSSWNTSSHPTQCPGFAGRWATSLFVSVFLTSRCGTGSSSPSGTCVGGSKTARSTSLAFSCLTSNRTPFLRPARRVSMPILTSPRRTLATPSDIDIWISNSRTRRCMPLFSPGISSPSGIRLTTSMGSKAAAAPTSSSSPRMNDGLPIL